MDEAMQSIGKTATVVVLYIQDGLQDAYFSFDAGSQKLPDMRSKTHVAIPIKLITIVLRDGLSIQTTIADAERKHRALGQVNCLKQGTAELLDRVAIGAGAFREQHYFKALGDGFGKAVYFLGQSAVFFTVGIEATSIAGDITQERALPHLFGGDEYKVCHCGENNDISIGSMIADGQIALVIHF